MGRRLRTEPEHLVNGLTFDERLAKLEGTVFGSEKLRGLYLDHDATRRRVEDLEHTDRQRRLPWYLRWFLNRRT